MRAHLTLPEGATIGFWVLIVKHDNTIQINSRLTGGSDSSMLHITDFLNENLSHFQIVAEEDPHYQGMQLLQDGMQLLGYHI